MKKSHEKLIIKQYDTPLMAISTIFFLNKMKKMNRLKTQKSKMNYWIGRGAVGERRLLYVWSRNFFIRKLQRI